MALTRNIATKHTAPPTMFSFPVLFFWSTWDDRIRIPKTLKTVSAFQKRKTPSMEPRAFLHQKEMQAVRQNTCWHFVYYEVHASEPQNPGSLEGLADWPGSLFGVSARP